MAKYKENARYEAVTFRTTKPKKEKLEEVAAAAGVSASKFMAGLLDAYLETL